MFYLDRTAFRENTSVWCFWSSGDHLFQEAFRSSDLPQIPANNWTHAVYADTRSYRHPHTHTCTNSHTNSKPAGSKIFFFPITFTLHFYNQPSGAFSTLLFFTALSCRSLTHALTHTRLLERAFTLLLSLQNTRHTHTCIHTVFLPGRLSPSGFPRRCWV